MSKQKRSHVKYINPIQAGLFWTHHKVQKIGKNM